MAKELDLVSPCELQEYYYAIKERIRLDGRLSPEIKLGV